MPNAVPDPGTLGPQSYRGAILVLLVLSALGGLLVAVSGLILANPVVVDAAAALCLSTGILFGVDRALRKRARQQAADAGAESGSIPLAAPTAAVVFRSNPGEWIGRRIESPPAMIAVVSALVAVSLFGASRSPGTDPLCSLIAAILTLSGSALAASGARYLASVDPERFPEGPGLARGARLLAWGLVAGTAAVGLAWLGLGAGVRFLHLLTLAAYAAVCIELFFAEMRVGPCFPTDLNVFSALGSRTNPVASLVDAAQRQLGIDLRSTWALDVVRRSAEPLVIGLLAVGWLSTSVAVVGVEEEGLVERLGVPIAGPPLPPGLHLHSPWPIDRVIRIPVRRVQTLNIGHEAEESSGPEDVLWARQHSETEYTLLLGNGRDLIAIDAAVQFRIADPRAWRYSTQNPVDALRAIAYRAVMRSTVGRTLAEALSENVNSLTAQMRGMVQADADSLGLGVQVVGFTVGGMHPPVSVAPDYQAVVSAALRKTTAAIEAQAYRNELVPGAEADVVRSLNAARADGARALGKAAGEAWSFRTLEAQYQAAPQEYRFRRRLETLEQGLEGIPFTVLDARIQRDGGELWLTR
jgi:membrane protease subunit HflK